MTFEYDEIESLRERIHQLEVENYDLQEEIYELLRLVGGLRKQVDAAYNNGYDQGYCEGKTYAEACAAGLDW